MKRYLSLLILFGLSITCVAQNGRAKRSDGTECTAFPCVVASVALAHQSTAAPRVPFYTPTTDGLFRISAYMNTTAGDVEGAYWELLFGWTDDVGTRSLHPAQKSYAVVSTVVNNLAGQPLTYSVTPHGGGGGGVGGMTYSLFVVVEQLQ